MSYPPRLARTAWAAAGAKTDEYVAAAREAEHGAYQEWEPTFHADGRLKGWARVRGRWLDTSKLDSLREARQEARELVRDVAESFA